VKPTRCPGDWHSLRWVTDSIALCVDGHKESLWVLADGGRLRLEPNRVARQLADRLVAQEDTKASAPSLPATASSTPSLDLGERRTHPWLGVALKRVPIDTRVYDELSRNIGRRQIPALTDAQWIEVRRAFVSWMWLNGLIAKQAGQLAGVGRGVISELTCGPRARRQAVPPVVRPFLVGAVLTPRS
jgi:hypothetical protein